MPTTKKRPPASPVISAAKPASKKPIAKAASRRVGQKPVPTGDRVGKPGPAASRQRVTRQSRSDDDFDPAAQLDKLDTDVRAPAGRRTRGTGGAPVVVGLPPDFFTSYTGEPLAEPAFEEAAQALGCELAAVRAVAEVESRGAGFDAARRPTLLYERHVFSRNTAPRGKHDASHPDVSFSKPYAPGTFGNSEQQWVRLGKAYGLDPVAALKAPSWGLFQILGENHKACGYAAVVDYARAMTTSPVTQLRAFVAFVRSSPTLLKAIRERNWAAFARAYNGPHYARYQYDQKMAQAYAKHSA